MNIIKLIEQFGKAHRSWYTHQSSGHLCDTADRLERRCRKLIRLSPLETELNSLLHKEIWSTTHLTPAR